MAYVKKNIATQVAEIERDSHQFLFAQNFLTNLRKYYLHKQLAWEDYSRLRKQALDGDIDGAWKSLSDSIKWKVA